MRVINLVAGYLPGNFTALKFPPRLEIFSPCAPASHKAARSLVMALLGGAAAVEVPVAGSPPTPYPKRASWKPG